MYFDSKAATHSCMIKIFRLRLRSKISLRLRSKIRLRLRSKIKVFN